MVGACRYPYWKAFTTGKGMHLGGIPHDVFGMTTRGVRAYCIGKNGLPLPCNPSVRHID